MECNFIVVDWQALQLQTDDNFFMGRTVRKASNHTAYKQPTLFDFHINQ